MSNIIKPPHSLVSVNQIDENKVLNVFLAGTIDMGNSEDWQSKIISEYKMTPIGNIFRFLNPRREEWNSSWSQTIETPQFYQQVNWELNALDKSDVIIMNFLPDSKSPITLLELGLYASSGKLIVSCPKEFWRRGNVEIVCERYNIPLYDNMEFILKNPIKIYKKFA